MKVKIETCEGSFVFDFVHFKYEDGTLYLSDGETNCIINDGYVRQGSVFETYPDIIGYNPIVISMR